MEMIPGVVAATVAHNWKVLQYLVLRFGCVIALRVLI
jgi:hypothetical protein